MLPTQSAPTFQPAMIEDMEYKEEEKLFSVWVNWDQRIISFQWAAGFEELQYPTYDEMFQFAIQKGSEGFGIQ